MRWNVSRCCARVWSRLVRWWFSRIRFDQISSGEADVEGQCIICFWHEDIFAALAFLTSKGQRRTWSALVSGSSDGDQLCRLLTPLGIVCVRGSSSRGGFEAMLALRRESREGRSILITPDGPKGPRRIVKKGVFTLSHLTGLPVCFLEFHYGAALALPTWDSARIPMPFCRIAVQVRVDPTHGRLTNVS